MEFEGKIESLATSLAVLSAYICLFDFLDVALPFLLVSLGFLLLVSFRRGDFSSIFKTKSFLGISLFLIFFYSPYDPRKLPLVAMLTIATICLPAKVEAFIPPVAGILSLRLFKSSSLTRLYRPLISTLASLSGVKVGVDPAGYFHCYFSRIRRPVLLDGVKAWVPFFFSILLAQVILLLLLKASIREKLLGMAFTTFLCVIMPSLIFIQVLRTGKVSTFLPNEPLALGFSLVPALLIASTTPEAVLASYKRTCRKKMVFPLLASFFVLSLIFMVPFEGRGDFVVIIDEVHSEWEPTWPDYANTLQKDPISAVNNYHGLLNFLSSVYECTLLVDWAEKRPAVEGVKVITSERITSEVLDQATQGKKGVLILKCVTSAYREDEINAILEFVGKGNGLILIGEHTDLYGMVTNLNPICEKLGYHMLPSALQDIYSEERGTITYEGEFPPCIARFLTGNYVWETGSHLERVNAPVRREFELLSHASCFVHWRNETSAFFLNREINEDIRLNSPFGEFIILASVQYGKGRAIIMTDSTPFNNALLGYGEHAQFFLSIVEHVGSRDRMGNIRYLVTALLVLIGILLVYSMHPVKAIVIMLALLMFGYLLSYPVARYTIEFPAPSEREKVVGVVLWEDYYEEYISGTLNVSRIMDVNLKLGKTPIIFPEYPPSGWKALCGAIEEFGAS